ncbi:hypothetical protein PsorP6_013341 [Peronosclerospora sorghi]|uniref:Uncharacterized protein n=1 Tax=Peronosclerospora sorghi TaxID=230839 RepID=A0ACC0WF22_9STRA|nr:hypothetical protein PsorP6_013341 [Peronosclerospora sorghi]
MAGTRLQIVAAFITFTLLVAPLAWHLTQVERADLPVLRIQALSWHASRFGGPVTFPVAIYSLHADSSISLAPSRATTVVYLTHVLELTGDETKKLDQAIVAGLQATDDVLYTLRPTPSMRFSLFLLCDEDAARAAPVLMVGKYRHAWSFRCQVEKGDELYAAIEKLMDKHVYPNEGEKRGNQPLDTRMARIARRYRLQFSLLKENPVTVWKDSLQTLVELYMGRFIAKVGAIANFTLETQVVQYARLAKEVTPSAHGKSYYIHADELKHAVVGKFKSVNDYFDVAMLEEGERMLRFMAALPDSAHSPLYIRSGRGNETDRTQSFEVPGWGLVVILNSDALLAPSSGTSAAIASATKERELQRVMGLFISGFRTFLGVSSFSHRQQEEENARGATSRRQLVFLPSIRDGIADWELDMVMRARFATLMQSAIETLQSTVALVEAFPELRVLERVQARVEEAVTRLEAILCTTDDHPHDAPTCGKVPDLAPLLVLAREAAELTDAAYNDHTMIRQLYFPQEKMWGVYAPLLAPLLLPFVLGFVRELRRFKAKRAAKR